MTRGTKLRLARLLALTAVVLTLAADLDSVWRVLAVVAGLHVVFTITDLIARAPEERPTATRDATPSDGHLTPGQHLIVGWPGPELRVPPGAVGEVIRRHRPDDQHP